MKVVGFSFIKNAVKYSYPIVEAIQSILPICDEVVVAVGNSNDGTRELVASIHPSKIRIIDTVWNDALKEGGKVLADETNKAFNSIRIDADWCVYIQGDEVMHEDGYQNVLHAMQQWKDDKRVDGLLFKYRHFYGSYDYIGSSSGWYRHEIRVVKNNKKIYSYKDAQGFRKDDNKKLNVKPVDAYIHHYGWVRPPKAMQAKQKAFDYYYRGIEAEEEKIYEGEFDYSNIDILQKYTGRHPTVMDKRIREMNWKFDYDLSYNKKYKPKEVFKNLIEKLTGKRPFDYQNYKII